MMESRTYIIDFDEESEQLCSLIETKCNETIDSSFAKLEIDKEKQHIQDDNYQTHVTVKHKDHRTQLEFYIFPRSVRSIIKVDDDAPDNIVSQFQEAKQRIDKNLA